MTVLFYAPNDGPYGCFSNFSKHTVDIYRRIWATSEHAFQAMKYHPHRPDLVEAILKADSPSKAAALGRDRASPLRIDWEEAIGRYDRLVGLHGKLTDLQVDDGRGLAPVVQKVKDVIMFGKVLMAVRLALKELSPGITSTV
jgi:hypothetical protein